MTGYSNGNSFSEGNSFSDGGDRTEPWLFRLQRGVQDRGSI